MDKLNSTVIGAQALPSLPKIDYFYTSKTLWTFVALILAMGCTRLWTGISATSNAKSTASGVPLIPYWIPFVGHAFHLGIRPESLLLGMRSSFPHGISSIVLAGSTHNMIWSPSLTQSVFSQRSTIIDFESIIWYILRNVGGVPKKWKANYEVAIPSLNAVVSNNLLKEPSLGAMIDLVVGSIAQKMPMLVSFCDRPIDQMPWERLADASIVSHADTISTEVSLLSLLINFTGHCALTSIFGPDLHRNYPDLLSDLWVFNNGFVLLAAGLPRWVPIQKLSTAYVARNRLCAALQDLHEAMDAKVEGRNPGSKWDDLDEVSQLIKERHACYRAHELPPEIRAPGDLAILWAMNANSNFLAFWLLLRILADPDLTQLLREEIDPFVFVQQPSNDFGPGVRELPRVRIDGKGLTTRATLLKSCYIEALRIDSAPWSLKKVLQDFTATESPADATIRGDLTQASYQIKGGTYASIPFDLHFNDPNYFHDPKTFIPDRHIVERQDENGTRTRTAEFGSVRPYGGGRTMCKGRRYAETELFALVAALLALWDFEPVDKQGWRLPKGGKATAVNLPSKDVRVRVKRRARRS